MNFRIEILHEINDVFDDNVDVYVILPNNEKYVATFFTLKNIATIMSRHRKSGESSSGTYFWSSDMIIVQSLNEADIKATIEDLLETDYLESVFMKID